MSDYFRYYASALASTKQIRWSSYRDITTGNELITGCLAVYNRSQGSNMLLGVQCMDVSLIISVSDFRSKPDYATAWSQLEAQSSTCYKADPTAAQLEELRGVAAAALGQSSCRYQCGCTSAASAARFGAGFFLLVAVYVVVAAPLGLP